MRAKFVVTVGGVPPFDSGSSFVKNEIEDALIGAGVNVIRVRRKTGAEKVDVLGGRVIAGNVEMSSDGSITVIRDWHDPQRPPKPLSDAIYDQEYWWRSSEGWIVISDMEPSHVTNLIAWLDRNAAAVAFRISSTPSGWPDPAEMSDGVFASYSASENKIDRMMDAPNTWMRGTRLYRKLLEVDAANLDKQQRQVRAINRRRSREDAEAMAEEHTWD